MSKTGESNIRFENSEKANCLDEPWNAFVCRKPNEKRDQRIYFETAGSVQPIVEDEEEADKYKTGQTRKVSQFRGV